MSESSPVNRHSTSIESYKKVSRDQLEMLKKRARKFKERIYAKYARQDLPYEKLLEKAKKYIRKYKLSDDEYQMFINLSLSDRGSEWARYNIPNTDMARVLGYSSINTSGDKLSVKADEMSVVNDIIRLHAETKALHSQVVHQSLTYKDCELHALLGGAPSNWNPYRGNAYSFVHPVIAALFLPKIRLLEEHMLLSNIGYIIKCKQQGQPIMTKPDFELYWDLITDPASHVCEVSPIKDLHNRYVLQTKLWENVLHLRQGRYYSDKLSDFMVAIDNCSSGVFEAPDLTYVKDEGTVLRRLLGAFAIRPTVVSTARMFNMVASTGYNPGMIDPLGAAGITQITTVPMVTLRLPYRSAPDQVISLQEALTQPQWFVENKTIVPKSQSILHSRDVIFFYVGRRFQHINVSKINSYPYNFTKLPMTIAGVEQINDAAVEVLDELPIMNEMYVLRSVVTLDKSSRSDKLIIGNSACVVSHVDGAIFEHNYYFYSPLSATQVFTNPANSAEKIRNAPITQLHRDSLSDDDHSSFQYRASHCGTIFMYQKIGSGSLKLPF